METLLSKIVQVYIVFWQTGQIWRTFWNGAPLTVTEGTVIKQKVCGSVRLVTGLDVESFDSGKVQIHFSYSFHVLFPGRRWGEGGNAADI
jgi:hypothetical protein